MEHPAGYGIVGACGVALSWWVAWRVSHRALKPVREMAERAEDWSAQNLARRFDLGPSVNELSQLGQTLDHLLDRVAHAIRAEQRFSAELAHEIRTPLAAISGFAELALLRKPADPELRTDLAEIADGTRRLAEVDTALLELAQNPGGHPGDRQSRCGDRPGVRPRPRSDQACADGLGTADRGPSRPGDPGPGAARGERGPARAQAGQDGPSRW